MKYTAALLLLGMVSTTEAAEHKFLAPVSDEMNVQIAEPCVYLDETVDELEYQIDMFSRTLDPRHWTNVLNIAKAMKENSGNAPKLQVHTWELYDKSFSFPRVRRYEFVQENMDMLEHFQDNLNTNISNSVHLENFLRVANTIRKNFNAKYHDGEFDDPANHDPREEAEAEKGWA
eukprot:CAMPEP_0170480622 /NCGR_PEP_ID=MMETSP0208-20121228/1396_1 /TAXON_ID=197538 /ORGANISM="Strombidium inclinatum, Strain S3" /LENGTH=174 /DNA_ID=CAMNT_0010753203 /DNA_START=75 /DNA_END=599 /DNA_ORIENTATION=+